MELMEREQEAQLVMRDEKTHLEQGKNVVPSCDHAAAAKNNTTKDITISALPPTKQKKRKKEKCGGASSSVCWAWSFWASL